MKRSVAPIDRTAAAPARRRGRPVGARSRVLAQDRRLGPHHFAFLRAWFQGINLRQAWDRYLAFASDSGDARVIERTRVELLHAVLAAGHQADRSHPELGLKRSLDLITREPFTPASAPIPSLADWVASERLDPDFSEAELLALYREHYGLGVGDDRPSRAVDLPHENPDSSAQVRALNHVAGAIVRPPSPTDRLALWLSTRLAAAIQSAGAATLAQLVDLINLYGYRWYRRVPGLGERRARAVAGWLAGLAGQFDRPLHEAALFPPQQQAALRAALARDLVLPSRFGLVPLEQLNVPPALSGRSGSFRAMQPNTLGADNDLDAIRAWLGRYERTHTARAYRREVERFYLWCLLLLGKPLSSVTSPDCQAYRRFLAAPPADWVQSRGVARAEAGWRPFRGPLQPSSQKQALVIVQTLFHGLQQAGYLVANPMAAVMKGFDLPGSRIHIERSLTRAEWDFVLAFAHAELPSPEQRRLLLLLDLLVSTGIRLEELARATRADLVRVPVDGETEDAWVLRVVGKRNKRREVPVADDTVALIERHQLDQQSDAAAPSPSAPLIGTLTAPPRRWAAAGAGTRLVTPERNPALSSSGIYRCLKRFFARAAAACAAQGPDPERLRAASTHWLRHTFGRQAIAAQTPTDVVQFALGHESLATTGIYVTTERSRMIRELRRARLAPTNHR